MKKLLIFTFLLALSLAMWSTAAAKPADFFTINLRACIDNGDGACTFDGAGDVSVDGATVCWRKGNTSWECRFTEDGEVYVDNQSPGAYWAQGEAPDGYRLTGMTCTTYPNVAYKHCKVSNGLVHFTASMKAIATYNAININFLMAPE